MLHWESVTSRIASLSIFSLFIVASASAVVFFSSSLSFSVRSEISIITISVISEIASSSVTIVEFSRFSRFGAISGNVPFFGAVETTSGSVTSSIISEPVISIGSISVGSVTIRSSLSVSVSTGKFNFDVIAFELLTIHGVNGFLGIIDGSVLNECESDGVVLALDGNGGHWSEFFELFPELVLFGLRKLNRTSMLRFETKIFSQGVACGL